MKIPQIMLIAFFLLLVLPLRQTYSQPVNEEACRSFFVVYCTTCHNTDRICKSLATQDEVAWQNMIHSVAEYSNLDETGEKQALGCMHFMQPGSKIVCREK